MVVVRGTADDNRARYNNATAYTNGAQFYITAAWDEDDVDAGRVPSVFTVGNNSQYEAIFNGISTRFVNIPLKSDTQYTIFTRYDVASDTGTEVKTYY